MSNLTIKASNEPLRNIADIEAHETVALTKRYPWESSYQLIIQAAQKFGQDAALEFLPTGAPDETSISISFVQLAGRINQTANLLHSVGIGAKDTVTVLLPSLPQTHFALWGGQAAGIASPINPLLEAAHIIEIMNETKAKVLITLGEDYNPELWAKVKHIVAHVPTLQTLLLVSNNKCSDIQLAADVNVQNFSKALEQQPPERLVSGREIKGNDIAAYFHTGGTTGRPKVAQLTHGNIAFVSQVYADVTTDKGRFATLCALPLFHIYGTVAAGIATLFCGRTLVMMTASGFRSPNVVPNWWHHVARFKVKSFAIVPTVLSALMQVPVGDNDISCLQEITCGAAPLPNSLKLNFEKKFNVSINNGYGMTESSCILARPFNDSVPVGSCGLRLPYMEMQIAHTQGNSIDKKCRSGEVGAVLVKGPHIFAGYLNPVDDATAWVDHTWFNTGDMGYMDDDGNLFLTGRAKDLIIRSGHNIDPLLIEEPLSNHPKISEAVAIGQPDAYAGELPVAYVTLNPGQKSSEKELLDYCRDTISERAAIPKRIEIMDEFPLTAVAKIFKPALRNHATEVAITQALLALDIQATVSARHDAKRGQMAKVHFHKPAQQADALAALEHFPVLVEHV